MSVGSGSWLGTGVIVLPGARIGRNVAVGAGSVVVGELPDHCVAVGVPAKVIKQYVAGDGWVATDQGHRSNSRNTDTSGQDTGVVETSPAVDDEIFLARGAVPREK